MWPQVVRQAERQAAAHTVVEQRGHRPVVRIDGIFRHQDSNGGGGLITDGDTQWMTAGRIVMLTA